MRLSRSLTAGLAVVPWTLVTVALMGLAHGVPAEEPAISEDERHFFENEIRPLLSQYCYECHSQQADPPEADLRLDSRAGWVQGSDGGPAIVPSNLQNSLLIQAVRYENTDLQMPPDGKLPAAAIEKLERWVTMGAPDPRVDESSARTEVEPFDLEKRRREHWAWQPLDSGTPPVVDDVDWPRHDLDRYILHRLRKAGLRPAEPADRPAFIRRVTFDLTGLPPSPEEIEAFLSDMSGRAYENLIDRLLASPHYGEHWGQHWLDLMRFAETRGHEGDYAIPAAFRYRDYVIHALNEDVSYRQFVMEHVAGDLLEKPRLHPVNRTNESVQGTGFWHLHEAAHSPVDIRGDEADRIHNQIDVFSRAFLGLSLGCARCHDHKFDALSTRDYYAMYGFLQSSSYRLADISDPELRNEVFHGLQLLQQDVTKKMGPAFADWRRQQLRQWTDVLLAAAEAYREFRGAAIDDSGDEPSGDSGDEDETVDPRLRQSVEAIAQRQGGLPVDLIIYLVGHIDQAATDLADPLCGYARIVRGNVENDVDQIVRLHQTWLQELRQREHQVQDQWKNLQIVQSIKDGERNYSPQNRPWQPADRIEDFDSANSDRWITDGHRFGKAPARPGQLLLGDADRPVRRVLEVSSAESDLISARLSGFIRTQTFEVVGDQLWYRYRGKADVFLAVDSHRVVKGPLHGVVKKPLDGDPDRWQWFSHSVRDYLGHRVHIEFTPREGFAVDQVVFAAEQPPEPFEAERFVIPAPEPAQLAGDPLEAYVHHISRKLEQRLESDSDGSFAPQAAAFANWLLRHENLLPAAETEETAVRQLAATYQQEKSQWETPLPEPIRALALLDGDPEDEPVHSRGNHRNRSAELVPRGFLTALLAEPIPPTISGSGRLMLAQQLADPSNPLISRVFANRIWYHLFGRGIVESVDDFGVMGTSPTHPQLLDFLAVQFIENGWSIKQLIRTIALSRTYRMSSRPDPGQDQLDPENKLVHRMSVRRLPAESIRDHILAVSGRLDRRLYGGSVMVHITPFMRGNRSPEGSGPLDGDGRRSIYTEARRNHLSAFLVAFDKPVPFMGIGKRTVSNSPAQSLILLNDPFVHEQAEVWAERLLAREDWSDRERIRDACLWAYGRPPSEHETDLSMEFLDSQTRLLQSEGVAEPVRQAWTDLCHTMMNVKEFIHIN